MNLIESKHLFEALGKPNASSDSANGKTNDPLLANFNESAAAQGKFDLDGQEPSRLGLQEPTSKKATFCLCRFALDQHDQAMTRGKSRPSAHLGEAYRKPQVFEGRTSQRIGAWRLEVDI